MEWKRGRIFYELTWEENETEVLLNKLIKKYKNK